MGRNVPFSLFQIINRIIFETVPYRNFKSQQIIHKPLKKIRTFPWIKWEIAEDSFSEDSDF
jgi:uncharacterized protein (DUF1919 family)